MELWWVVSVLGVIFLALLARSLVYHYFIPMLRVPAIDVDASDGTAIFKSLFKVHFETSLTHSVSV